MAGMNPFDDLEVFDFNFENSHSRKDLRKKKNCKPKIDITQHGESLVRLYVERRGKSSSKSEVEFEISGGLLEADRYLIKEQPSSHRVLIKEEENKEKKPSSQSGPINKEMKVTNQLHLKEKMENLKKKRNNKASSQPKSHSKRSHTMALFDTALSEIESCQELKRESKKISRHEENLLILKKFLKVRQEKEDNSQGVFFANSFPSRNDVSSVEKRVKQMATTLAMVTLRQWMLNGWKDLEKKIPKPIYAAFQDSVFKSFVKLILSIFDTEDLERCNFVDKLDSEYKRFYGENLLPLEDADDPIKLIAEGKITFDSFPSLTESDIASLMLDYSFDPSSKEIDASIAVNFMNLGLNEDGGGCFMKGRHKRYVEMARVVMLQYAPLKEEIMMHTLLENVLLECYCTSDALQWEALCDCGILDIKNHLNSADFEDTLEEVAWRIDKSMSILTSGRYLFLRDFASDVTFPLVRGPFGAFADEVIDLVKIAEGRRRYEGHRYINMHHILWAVGLTGVKGFVDKLVDGIGLQNLVEKPATHPPYNMYMSARNIANILGNDKVRVEHLVVAIVFEMNQRRLKEKVDVSPPLVADGSAWNEFKSMKCVKAFLNAMERYKKKPGRNLINLPTKIVAWPVPEGNVMDQLRRLEKDMKYGWHEFAGFRCELYIDFLIDTGLLLKIGAIFVC